MEGSRTALSPRHAAGQLRRRRPPGRRGAGGDRAARVGLRAVPGERPGAGAAVLQEVPGGEGDAGPGLGRGRRRGAGTYGRHRHPPAGRPARHPRGDGEARHAPDHHRQGPGLHRHARVPEQPEPGVPERAGARHRRALASPASARRTCSTSPATATTTRASAVHEFCHTIDAALGTDRPRPGASASARPTGTRSPQGSGRTPMPAPTRANTGPRSASPTSTATGSTTGITTSIGTREQLKQYDPEGYDLVRTTFRLTPEHGLDARRCSAGSRASSRRRPGSRSTRITPSSPGRASSRCSGRTRSATRRCSRPTTRSGRCSPTGTTS